MKRRSLVLAADTAAVAATNASILIVGARLLNQDDLSSLTMVQLLVVTAVGLQRATLLTPAFASQRSSGAAVVPLRWIVYISLPGACASAVLMPMLTPRGQHHYAVVAILCLFATLLALVQDLLRFAFFTRQRAEHALLSDLTWLMVSSAGLIAAANLPVVSWIQLILTWGASGGVAALVGLFLLWKWRSGVLDKRYVRVREVWTFGKWSGADAALSGAANLLPMAVSTLALGSSVAAIYRLLQTANGPFNILSATFLTSVGMDAWKLADADEVRALRRRTIRQSLLLVLIAGVFYAVAFPVILYFSGITGEDSLRVAIILTVSGVLGAATIPISAAASAMGFQKVGFFVRIIVITSAVAVSVLAAAGFWIPWSDPVGIVAIISSVAGLAGWAVGYELGYRRESA